VSRFTHVLCALAALPIATAASATDYSLVSGFGSSVFSYGAGSYSNGAINFTAFTSTYNNCFNRTGFTCTTSGPAGDQSGSSNLPGIGKVDGDTHFLTVDVPADELWAHPAQGGGNTDAMIRFTAEQTGSYSVNGLFQRLDEWATGSNDPGNNGVSVAVYLLGANGVSELFSSDDLLGVGIGQGAQASYFLSNVALNAGDSLFWVVSNNGNYYNDSTGVAGTIHFNSENISLGVPEPASWTLMVMGFGLAGLGLRSTRRTRVTFG
jgi:hypothetical protein